MKKYKYIFIVLVYKNTADLLDFFTHLNIEDSHVIVVNSFFDEKTDRQFKEIAETNYADFISVENKGYGAGNNTGVSFALKNYKFDYLIISNADIEIKSFDIKPSENAITAPEIKTINGKRQNPHTPYYLSILERIKYLSFKNDSKTLLLVAVAINKLFRSIFWLLFNIFNKKRLHAVHGSFFIIPYQIVQVLSPLFNSEMFLFAEEDHLAMKIKQNGFRIEYNPNIKVLHKEDGSVGISNINHFKLTKESYLIYYNYWYNKNQ